MREGWTPTAESARRARQEPPESADVVVVGAGLGGLGAAAWLARAGLRVAVLDGHYVAGGCATMFQRKCPEGRLNFDVGLHYVGDCGREGMIPRLLRGVGIEDIDWRPLDPDGFDTLVFPDFRFRVPANREVFRDRLVEMFPAERKGIDRYVRFLAEVDRLGARVDAGRTGFGLAVEALLHGRLAARYQKATIADVLDSCTRDPKLRAVLVGQHGDYGLPPAEVAAVLHAGLANHYFKGAFYPRGGGQVIADRLTEVIESLGGSIHLRRPVERILIEGGRVVGVRTEPHPRAAHEIRAPIVISNADLKRTASELVGPEHLPREWAERVSSLRMAGALFMTFLAVRDDLGARGLANTNYWQFDGYAVDDFYRGLRGETFEPAGAYITSASLKDPGSAHHAPAGVHTVEVMTVVPGDSASWGLPPDEAPGRWQYRFTEAYQLRKQAVEDDMVRRLEALFPGSTAHVVHRESATPVTHSRFTRASGGTAYGIAATPDQFLEARPGYRTPVPGLWVSGASTRAGHGIVGALLSGYRAAASVARSLERPLPKF